MAQVLIVLVRTSHPGNIGAAARAMKNMGLQHLRLVQPSQFPSATATARASGADDLLMRATVCETLAEAVADCRVVIGTSARLRSIAWPVVDVREAAGRAVQIPGEERVAIVFGNEQAGLSNTELDQCEYLLQIPTSGEYSSLNLAMAVQVVAYELRMAHLRSPAAPAPASVAEAPLATSAEREAMYEHLRDVMTRMRFLNPDNPRHLMRRMRRLFNRAEMDENEVQIMRGLLASVEKFLPDVAPVPIVSNPSDEPER